MSGARFVKLTSGCRFPLAIVARPFYTMDVHAANSSPARPTWHLSPGGTYCYSIMTSAGLATLHNRVLTVAGQRHPMGRRSSLDKAERKLAALGFTLVVARTETTL